MNFRETDKGGRETHLCHHSQHYIQWIQYIHCIISFWNQFINI